jgi:hypothetical protein
MTKKFIRRLLLTIIFVSLTGCGGSYNRVDTLSGGYQETAHIQYSSSEPEGSQTSIQYRTPNGRQVTIWPSISSGPIIKNDIAIFVGNVAWEPRKFGERWDMGGRLFAVKSPEPLLDITDEILWRWSNKNGIDFEKALKIAVAVTIEEKENQLEIRFAFWGQNGWPRIVLVDWNQISDIMREVKEKGVVHKDSRWGTSYIEKEFKPEVQK